MSRVLALVEGPTEQSFIKQVLAPELHHLGVYLTAAIIGKPGHKGGIRSYESIRREILAVLKQDQQRYCTTMFDYYGLPAGWPGKTVISGSPSIIAGLIEQAMLQDVCSILGQAAATSRLIPYIQMHEYEALLFSEPATLATAVGQRTSLGGIFEAIVNECGEPEAIDDRPDTAPSKRIKNHVRDYNKVIHGTIAAQRIGLPKMRQRCPHFSEWVARLETLGVQESAS